MKGELWQECEECGEEPVCVDCERCERHCTCAQDEADRKTMHEFHKANPRMGETLTRFADEVEPAEG